MSIIRLPMQSLVCQKHMYWRSGLLNHATVHANFKINHYFHSTPYRNHYERTLATLSRLYLKQNRNSFEKSDHSSLPSKQSIKEIITFLRYFSEAKFGQHIQ